MSVLVISRSEEKLKEQTQLIGHKFKVPVKYLAYDFTQPGEVRKEFYAKLDKELEAMDKDGGVGLLINNVGIANEYPKKIDEFSDEEIDAMIQCNIYSTVFMTRAVMKYMLPKKNGCVVSISSGSHKGPGPYLQLYSATK
jgi:short-subunit dehydrogenase